MTQSIIKQPTNTNPLYPNKWIFTIPNMPHLIYFVRGVLFPGVQSSPALMETRFSKVHFTGDKIEYDDLTLGFEHDEDMKTYEETFKWMQGYSFPTEHGEYVKQAKSQLYADATLEMQTNNNTSNFKIRFYNCFPKSLNAFDLTYSEGPDAPVLGSVTFQYDRFEFDRS